MRSRPFRITVTGSECTGKSTLAGALASRFGALWVPEYCRAYQDSKGPVLTAQDVEPIASGQIAAFEEAEAAGSPLLILDTDLLSTVIYARHYYGACPDWIASEAVKRRADLYLLCDIDVPWLADGHRDRGEAREEMQGLFVAGLAEFECKTALVSGVGADREENAARAITLFQERAGQQK